MIDLEILPFILLAGFLSLRKVVPHTSQSIPWTEHMRSSTATIAEYGLRLRLLDEYCLVEQVPARCLRRRGAAPRGAECAVQSPVARGPPDPKPGAHLTTCALLLLFARAGGAILGRRSVRAGVRGCR
jgi:hypothetical protein